MANTHFSHVLAGTGGAGTEEDSQRPVTMDGFSCKWEDITATDSADYLVEPGQIVLRVEGTVAVLDAIAAAPGNVELFRDELPQEVV